MSQNNKTQTKAQILSAIDEKLANFNRLEATLESQGIDISGCKDISALCYLLEDIKEFLS